mgnify:CR=1 FL=1
MTEEAKLKKALKALLDSEGAYWAEVKGGAHSKPGDPDIIACIDGLFMGIEAKTPTGRLSPLQYRRAHEIIEAGGMWVCARSVSDLAEAIAEARQRAGFHRTLRRFREPSQTFSRFLHHPSPRWIMVRFV